MISRTILECEVYCASLIPCQGKLDQYLPQSIFSIDTYGSLTISQWKIITNNKDTVLNEPTLCDETLEIGTNIFKEVSFLIYIYVYKYIFMTSNDYFGYGQLLQHFYFIHTSNDIYIKSTLVEWWEI